MGKYESSFMRKLWESDMGDQVYVCILQITNINVSKPVGYTTLYSLFSYVHFVWFCLAVSECLFFLIFHSRTETNLVQKVVYMCLSNSRQVLTQDFWL